jgi:predicted RNase H-like HicB family nuclease
MQRVHGCGKKKPCGGEEEQRNATAPDEAGFVARVARLSCGSSPLLLLPLAPILRRMSEIIFEVREDETEGGYIASALGFGIHTQAESVEELRARIREAVDCHFDETMEAPRIIRLHFVRDEVMAR